MGPVSQKGSVRPLPFVVKLDWLQHSTFVTAKVPYLLSSFFPIFHQITHGYLAFQVGFIDFRSLSPSGLWPYQNILYTIFHYLYTRQEVW